MATDSTYLYFQCNSSDEPSSPSIRTARINTYGRMRGDSAPRVSTVRSRSGSVPPLTYRPTPQRPITVESLAAQKSLSGVTAHRRASIAVPNGTSLATYGAGSVTSYRSPLPIHTYSPDKGLTLVTTERRSARPPAATTRASAPRAAGSYYRVRSVHDDEDFGPAPPRRSGSVTRKVVTKEGIVENGHRRPQVSVEFEPTQNYLPNHSLADLRQRTKVAKDHLDKHRVLLDKYLPINLGPSEDVEYEVEAKYGELVERMPHLEYRHRKSLEEPDTYTSIEPYRPVTRAAKYEPLPVVNLPPVRNSFTPKVSDVRKRARRVLCSIKGDPRYFDFS